MNASWQTKIIFWMAISASSLWLLLAIAAAAAVGLPYLREGITPSGSDVVEILIVCAFIIHPFVLLWLIIRAIRSRRTGRSRWIVARALYPLLSVVLIPMFSPAIAYLNLQSHMRTGLRWRTGSITYVCSSQSRSADYDPATIGPIQLRLSERRYPGRLGDWTVLWPGKKPIRAKSFAAATGSEGGSEGIQWLEPDGRSMIAYVSFSDVMNELGPSTIWIAIEPDRIPKLPKRDAVFGMDFTCGPDARSYHA